MTEREWTIKHATEAFSQGWSLFHSSTRGLEIERDDEAGIFDSDEDAVEYVRRQAKRGNACAIEALRLVDEAQAERSTPTCLARAGENMAPGLTFRQQVEQALIIALDAAVAHGECLQTCGHEDCTREEEAEETAAELQRLIATLLDEREWLEAQR